MNSNNNLHPAADTIRKSSTGMEQRGVMLTPRPFIGEIPEGWGYDKFLCSQTDEIVEEWEK